MWPDVARSWRHAPARFWSAGTFARCVKKKIVNFNCLSLHSAVENGSFSCTAARQICILEYQVSLSCKRKQKKHTEVKKGSLKGGGGGGGFSPT